MYPTCKDDQPVNINKDGLCRRTARYSPSPVKDLETTVAQSFLQPKDGPGTTGSSAKMLFSKDWTTTVTFAFSHQVWMTTPQIPILKIPQPGKLGETKCSFEQKLLQVVNHPPVPRWTEVCLADPHRRNATLLKRGPRGTSTGRQLQPKLQRPNIKQEMANYQNP